MSRRRLGLPARCAMSMAWHSRIFILNDILELTVNPAGEKPGGPYPGTTDFDGPRPVRQTSKTSFPGESRSYPQYRLDEPAVAMYDGQPASTQSAVEAWQERSTNIVFPRTKYEL